MIRVWAGRVRSWTSLAEGVERPLLRKPVPGVAPTVSNVNFASDTRILQTTRLEFVVLALSAPALSNIADLFDLSQRHH